MRGRGGEHELQLFSERCAKLAREAMHIRSMGWMRSLGSNVPPRARPTITLAGHGCMLEVRSCGGRSGRTFFCSGCRAATDKYSDTSAISTTSRSCVAPAPIQAPLRIGPGVGAPGARSSRLR